jgi:hypothetical protein
MSLPSWIGDSALEADLEMGSIAQRFLTGSTAAAEGVVVAIGQKLVRFLVVDQFDATTLAASAPDGGSVI